MGFLIFRDFNGPHKFIRKVKYRFDWTYGLSGFLLLLHLFFQVHFSEKIEVHSLHIHSAWLSKSYFFIATRLYVLHWMIGDWTNYVEFLNRNSKKVATSTKVYITSGLWISQDDLSFILTIIRTKASVRPKNWFKWRHQSSDCFPDRKCWIETSCFENKISNSYPLDQFLC